MLYYSPFLHPALAFAITATRYSRCFINNIYLPNRRLRDCGHYPRSKPTREPNRAKLNRPMRAFAPEG